MTARLPSISRFDALVDADKPTNVPVTRVDAVMIHELREMILENRSEQYRKG